MSAKDTMSRRKFLKTASAATAIAAAGALATGCAAKGASSGSAGGEAEPSWTHEAEVVVVGLGAAGAAAFASAAEQGVRVIALEAADKAGGTTVLSGGLVYFGGGTAVQSKLNIEDSPENFKAYFSKAVGPSADPELVSIFCEESPDLCGWCIDHGMVFEGQADTAGHTVEAPEGVCLMYSGNERAADFAEIATPAPRAHIPQGGASAIVNTLIDSTEGDTDILYKTALEDLVVDGSGTVTGLKAKGPDGEIFVKASKGVILTTGAFTMNESLVANCRPEALACRGRTASPYDMGDGMVAAQKIGAATRSLSRVTVGAHVYMYGALSQGVLVDHRAHRILAEDWYGSFIGRTILENSLDKCFIILDQATLDEVMTSPFAAGLTNIISAESIEELAASTGLDATSLASTIERYNSLCSNGRDVDFGKSEEYLIALGDGPYHAVSVRPQDFAAFFTLGGLKINASSQVIDLDGKPIPGLYAAGRCSCGVFGEYAGSGSSIADALTFGRIAGRASAAS